MTKEYRIFPIDNIPDGASPWLISDFPVPVVGGSLQANAQLYTLSGVKWYGGPATNAYLTMTPANYGVNWATVNKVIFGARTITQNITNFAVGVMIGTSGAAVGGNVIGSNIGVVAGVECNVEVVFERAKLTATYFLDGVQKYVVQLTQAQWDTFSTTNPCIYFGGGWGISVTWYMKDFYLAYADGADDVSRLGPINISAARAASVSGANWKKGVNQGDTDYLSMPTDRFGTMFAPRFENPAGNGAITQRLLMPANLPDNAKILGVQFQASGQDRAAVLKNLTGSIVQGGQTVALQTKQFTLMPIMGRNFSSLRTVAPDGGAWTKDKLNATDYVLSLG